MYRIHLICLSTLLYYASAALAQSVPVAPPPVKVDRERLRASVYLPIINPTFMVQESLTIGDDQAEKANGIRKPGEGASDALPVDVESYFELAESYAQVGDLQSLKKPLDQLGKLLQPLFQGNDPKYGPALSRYSHTMSADPSRLDEAETWARRAVALAPGDWTCWETLAQRNRDQALKVLIGKDWQLVSRAPIQGIEGIAEKVRREGLAPEVAAIAAQRLQEVQDCAEAIRRLAPGEVFTFLVYYRLRTEVATLMPHIAALNVGVRGPMTDNSAATDIAQAFADVAELHPDRFSTQGAGLLQLLKAQPPSVYEAANPLAVMTPQVRQKVEKYLERIAKLGRNRDRKVAVSSEFLLMHSYQILKNAKATEMHARLAVELAPDDLQAHECLVFTLRGNSCLAATIKLIERFPTARSHFLLARAFGGSLKRFDEAEKSLRAGLLLAPDDAYCTLGLAATLLRRGTPASLAQAAELIERGRGLLKSDATLAGYCEFLTAVHAALTGPPDVPRYTIMQLADRDPTHEGLKQAVAAFTP